MDAEHGANKATGRADGGHVIFAQGGLVSWQSKGQVCVTDSTFGSEMVEFSRGAKKICKLWNYQADLGRPATAPANTDVDNQWLMRMFFSFKVPQVENFVPANPQPQ